MKVRADYLALCEGLLSHNSSRRHRRVGSDFAFPVAADCTILHVLAEAHGQRCPVRLDPHEAVELTRVSFSESQHARAYHTRQVWDVATVVCFS